MINHKRFIYGMRHEDPAQACNSRCQPDIGVHALVFYEPAGTTHAQMMAVIPGLVAPEYTVMRIQPATEAADPPSTVRTYDGIALTHEDFQAWLVFLAWQGETT